MGVKEFNAIRSHAGRRTGYIVKRDNQVMLVGVVVAPADQEFSAAIWCEWKKVRKLVSVFSVDLPETRWKDLGATITGFQGSWMW